jgi:predicted dehydrogenase
VGVIGLGFGAKVVAPAFAKTDGCEVVDVVSPRDEAAVAKLCARGDVDLVSVHSPPFLHAHHVRLATQAGHAVLCDKPFGRGAAEAAEMCDLARAAGVPGFLNFENRYDAARLRLRALLE